MNYIEYPEAFLLLFLPFIVYYFSPKIKGLHGDALRVPFLEDLKFIKEKASSSYSLDVSSRVSVSFKFIYIFLIWALLVFALSKPQYVGEPHRLKTENRDIVLVIDISTSMLEEDFSTNQYRLSRLSALKHVVSKFIEDRKEDRLGLILFGTRAYLQSPLTFDKQSIKDILLGTDAGMAGNSTAIGDALGLALKTLKDEKNKENKIIILLTDGENNDGHLSMPQIIEMSEKEKIKIYTIGMGADVNFLSSFFGMSNHNLDEKSLKLLSQKTKGNYFRAKDLSSLAEIYSRIDKLEPENSDNNVVQEKKNLFYFPLSIALILSFFLLFIPRRFIK